MNLRVRRVDKSGSAVRFGLSLLWEGKHENWRALRGNETCGVVSVTKSEIGPIARGQYALQHFRRCAGQETKVKLAAQFVILDAP